MTVREATLLRDIPSKIDNSRILNMLDDGNTGSTHLQAIKDLTMLNDKKISAWFDISEKTYREFKIHRSANIKVSVRERAIAILSLIKHGIGVFGTAEKFTMWLEKENFYFDKRPPIEWMNTHSGIKFIDDSLTGIEYGDNA